MLGEDCLTFEIYTIIMITRNVEQVKVFKLILNPMTDRAESGRIVAIAYDRDEMVAWYNSQLADEVYQDGQWNKSFKKGSQLEWFNPVFELDEIDMFGHGIHWEWAEQRAIDYYINKANQSFDTMTVPYLVPHGQPVVNALCSYCGSMDNSCNNDIETETCKNLK